MASRSAPPHPGDVLLRKFLTPRRFMQADFARAIGMAQSNLSTFIAGRRALTPWMAWAFARELQTTPRYWMDLQSDYELWRVRPRRAARKAPKERPRR